MQAKIAELAPLLETLPESDITTTGEEVTEWQNWRQIHDQCLSLQSQWQTLQQQLTQELQRAAEAQTAFESVLQSSVFADQAAFLAALLDEESYARLEQFKQSLEQHYQQVQTLSNQASQALVAHQQQRPADLEPQYSVEHIQQALAQLAYQLQENAKRQGEIRQQIKQDADNRQQQQTLMAQIDKATQQVEDWGCLNALIGSKEGDKFRKFAQGLTLDNLVHLANRQLTRLHGRYLLQRKASEALEVEVVDTAGRCRTRYPHALRG